MIIITDYALEKAREFLNQSSHDIGIKFGVKSTGCSGLAYTTEYVESAEPGDLVQKYDDISIVVDASSIDYLDGMTVDYVKRGLNEGFEFTNPNEKHKCGCGLSFTV